MQELMTTTDAPQTMSSLDLLEVVNKARLASNLEPLRRNVFHSRVEDELEGMNYKSFVIGTYDGAPVHAYELDEDQALLVAMRESKFVRRSVLAQLKEMRTQNADLKQQLIETQQQEIKRLSSQVKRVPTFDRPEHFCLIEDDTLADVACIPLTHIDKARRDANLRYDGDMAVNNGMLGAFSPEGCLAIIDQLPASVHHRVRWDNLNDFFDHAVRAAFRRAKVYTITDYRRERTDSYWATLPTPLPWQKAIQKDAYPVHDPRLFAQ